MSYTAPQTMQNETVYARSFIKVFTKHLVGESCLIPCFGSSHPSSSSDDSRHPLVRNPGEVERDKTMPSMITASLRKSMWWTPDGRANARPARSTAVGFRIVGWNLDVFVLN